MKKIYVCSAFLVFFTLEFIILKVVGVINWSWLWILSPIWFVLLLTGLLSFCLIFAIKKEEQRPKRKGVLTSKLEALQKQQERLQQERKAKG